LGWLVGSWDTGDVGGREPEIVSALSTHEVVGVDNGVVLVVAVAIVNQVELETG
jgi:hypothetical protein